MKFLFDLFPVVLFFIAYEFGGIYVATGVAMAATVAQISWVWFRHRKVEAMLWVTLGLVSVFGGATILLHDPTFIKWKPTVLYWLIAAVLLFSAVALKKNLVRKMLEAQVRLPDPVWARLNGIWAAFFVALGAANLYVAGNFSEATWVKYKLFGTMGLMLVFFVLQGLYLSRHMIDDPKQTP